MIGMPVTALAASGIGVLKITEEQLSNKVNRFERKDRQLRRVCIAPKIYQLARQQRELHESGNAVIRRQHAQTSGDVKIVVAGVAEAVAVPAQGNRWARAAAIDRIRHDADNREDHDDEPANGG
jgi:hypothetical protein